MENRSHSFPEVPANRASTGRPACELLAALFSTLMGLMLLLGQWSRLADWIKADDAGTVAQHYGADGGVCAVSLIAGLEGTLPGYLLAGFFLVLAMWYGTSAAGRAR